MTGMSASAPTPSVRRISQDSPWHCESYNSENATIVHFNHVITSANQYISGDNGLLSTEGVNAKIFCAPLEVLWKAIAFNSDPVLICDLHAGCFKCKP